jgi:hypothetical protein
MKVSSFTNYYNRMPNWLQGVLWGGLFAIFLTIGPIILAWFIQSLCILGIDIDCTKYIEISYVAIFGGTVIPN